MHRGKLLKANFPFLSCLCIGVHGQSAITPLEVRVQGPAYVGEPIWVEMTAGSTNAVIYPFTASFENIGCNKIELKRGETQLEPLADLTPPKIWTGPPCGTQAPPGAPPNRLPLHLLFRIDQTGEYAIRWTDLSHHISSKWVSFSVVQPDAEQREAWLISLLVAPPTNAGFLAGDFLPALAAALPDKRAIAVFETYSNFSDPRVSGFARAGLKHLTATLMPAGR